MSQSRKKADRLEPVWHVRSHLPSLSKPNTTRSNKFTFQFVTLHLCYRLIPHISPGVGLSGLWVVDLAGRACGLTSGPARRASERQHGWMIPTEGRALLTLGLRRASTWETAWVLFPTDGSAPETGGRRQSAGKGGQSVVFPSPPLVFMTFAFYLPLTLPGERNVANLVFICLKTAVWYCICQHFRAVLAQSSTVVKCAAIKKIIPLVLITALWNGFFNS